MLPGRAHITNEIIPSWSDNKILHDENYYLHLVYRPAAINLLAVKKISSHSSVTEKVKMGGTLLKLGTDIKLEMEELSSETSRKAQEEFADFTYLMFSLDKDYKIINTSHITLQYLHRNNERLIGLNFKDLLDSNSALAWEKFSLELPKLPSNQRFIELTFLTGYTKQITSSCQFDKMVGAGTEYMVNTCDWLTYQDRPFHQQPHIKLTNLMSSEYRKNMPTIKELALRFGTSEYRLRKEFKKWHGKTPLQYHKKRRLTEAYNDFVPEKWFTLKKAASLVGYKNYSSFSVAYKKQFGFTPTEHRKSQESKEK